MATAEKSTAITPVKLGERRLTVLWLLYRLKHNFAGVTVRDFAATHGLGADDPMIETLEEDLRWLRASPRYLTVMPKKGLWRVTNKGYFVVRSLLDLSVLP